jgi:hypothetical protein
MPEAPDIRTPNWRKSTRSGGSNNCVEAATNIPDRVLVRDTKDVAGPVLTFGPSDWRQFTSGIRGGSLAR